MFLGTYEHSLDVKGRVILPAKFRDDLGAGAYLAKSLDGCLSLYTADEFNKVVQEMQETARRGGAQRHAVRSFGANASEATPDRQGRISIPPPLRDYAHLDREVVIVGALSRVEIWDAARWRAVDSENDARLVEADADLADIGI